MQSRGNERIRIKGDVNPFISRCAMHSISVVEAVLMCIWPILAVASGWTDGQVIVSVCQTRFSVSGKILLPRRIERLVKSGR